MPFTSTAVVVDRLTAHGEPHDRITDPRPPRPEADEYTPTLADRKVARIASLG